MTITVVVGQALRDGLTKREQIEEFVDRLRAGAAKLEDDPKQGRSRSLGASLQYGFEHTFTDDEHRILALLHLFQGFVDVDVLKVMGDPDYEWCLNEIRGLTRESGISLLDRAAEVGLLTSHGGGYYSIHPALPWFFNELFQTHYPDSSDGDVEPPARRAEQAFVEAMGELSNYYVHQYNLGNRDVIAVLATEEANLLHARRLARENCWWTRVVDAMQGLRSLYQQTGRRAEWKRLVEEIIPDFVDPKTDGPLSGPEEDWSLVTQYRVCLAREERDWEEAERLQAICVEWDRKRAAPVLEVPGESLDPTQRGLAFSLGASLHDLGQIQQEMGRAECVKSYEEALKLAERIGDNTHAAICAYNLAGAYEGLPDLRDLDRAEELYQRGLELFEESDRLGRAGCLAGQGYIALRRFDEARGANEPEEVLLKLLNQALGRYLEALGMLPKNAVADLAVTHNQLGGIYLRAGQMDRALHHYNQSIQYEEQRGSLYGAGQTRFNVAIALMQSDRFQDALSYARAALRNYETYGGRAAEEIQRAKSLIAQIEAGSV